MQPLLSFMDAVLRGIGQVMFQNNRYAGLLFLAGVGVQSWHCAVAMVLGTVVSTGAACVLGVERSALRDGLYGFNGALVGVAAAVFFQPTGGMWAVLVAGAIASTVVMSALSALLARWSIAALTAPFVFTMWVLLSAAPQFVGLASDGQVSLPSAVASAGTLTQSTWWEGTLHGIGQVFLQENWLTGALIGGGLLVSSRRAFLAAIFGAVSALVVAWALGAEEVALRAGLFSFNSVLVAIALGSTFLPKGARFLAYAALATVLTPLVHAAVASALTSHGVPALTFSFVIVTWAFLLARPRFSVLRDRDEART